MWLWWNRWKFCSPSAFRCNWLTASRWSSACTHLCLRRWFAGRAKRWPPSQWTQCWKLSTRPFRTTSTWETSRSASPCRAPWRTLRWSTAWSSRTTKSVTAPMRRPRSSAPRLPWSSSVCRPPRRILSKTWSLRTTPPWTGSNLNYDFYH